MRIVSLLPAATEMVCELGLQNELVGISQSCDFPMEVQQLPRISASSIATDAAPDQIDREVISALQTGKSIFQVDLETLLSLEPDLIISQDVCEVCAVSINDLHGSLRSLRSQLPGDCVILNLSGRTIAGVLKDLVSIGNATDKLSESQKIASNLQSRWQALKSSTTMEHARIFVLEWTDPPYYAGHWMPEIIEHVGGINATGAAGEKSNRTTWKQIEQWDPDLLFVASCGHNLKQNQKFAHSIYEDHSHRSIKAICNENIWAFDANGYTTRPGPRLMDTAESVFSLIRGDEVDPLVAARIRCI